MSGIRLLLSYFRAATRNWRTIPVLVAVVPILMAGACGGAQTDTLSELEARIRAATASVNDARLASADDDPGNWLSTGRNYAEDRYSALDDINVDSVGGLGLVWSLELGTRRGLEATPLVVDGVIFTTGTWSVVYAIAAQTGELIWSYDPEVPAVYGPLACCDVVNRGVALYRGKVYVATLDGRLVALDAATGAPVWATLTIDRSKAYTVTGAPRVADGKVIIGNGGAEYGVRGYVTAYDAETGVQVWRTYTVPGDPSLPFESDAIARAADTWTGEWWIAGGGGTAWDSMAYDPDLDLFYVGTGNGSPWNRAHRSPGGGDNLYLSSIIALRPSDGEMVWHFQTTPGDTWDYTATQHMILADLEIEGEPRSVIMQAPKNGFFYVLDRATGEFISAESFIGLNWAERVDPKTGRPVEATDSDYMDGAMEITPGPLGGHNFQPMAYNPHTGLVYIPTHEFSNTYADDPGWDYRPVGLNLAARVGNADQEPTGHLLAWDPARQSEAWRVPQAGPWNGGILTTAGGLVFQGAADGRFVAYQAETGEQLWESFLGTGIIAAPITYEVDGRQYVTVMAGWGGAYGLRSAPAGEAARYEQDGRIYTFALVGEAALPRFTRLQREVYAAEVDATVEEIQTGAILYRRHCNVCHDGVIQWGHPCPGVLHERGPRKLRIDRPRWIRTRYACISGPAVHRRCPVDPRLDRFRSAGVGRLTRESLEPASGFRSEIGQKTA